MKPNSFAPASPKSTNCCATAAMLARPGSRPPRRTLRRRRQAAIRRAVHVRDLPQRTRHRARRSAGRHDAGAWSPGDELAAEDQLYRDMRAKLEAMGPVNMMALEEYKETAERHTFLETQRTGSDLVDREHDGDHQRDRSDLAAEIRRGIPQDQREFPGDVQETLRRRPRAS